MRRLVLQALELCFECIDGMGWAANRCGVVWCGGEQKVMLKTGDVVSVVTSTKRNGVGNSKCLCAGTAHADVMVREVLVGHR